MVNGSKPLFSTPTETSETKRNELLHNVQANSNFSSKELKVYIIPLARKCERMDKESKEGRMADALALGGDEGRDKLR